MVDYDRFADIYDVWVRTAPVAERNRPFYVEEYLRIEPEQMRALLEETGFEIEALYGEFDRRPFDNDSPEQVWIARRPAADSQSVRSFPDE